MVGCECDGVVCRDWKLADQLRGSIKKKFSVMLDDNKMEWWVQQKLLEKNTKDPAAAAAGYEHYPQSTV